MSAPRGSAAYAAMFAGLRLRKEGAFVPFLVLGDPRPDLSLELARALVQAGADALELGLPFSDPIADGPVVQAGAVRSLAAGTTPRSALDLVARLREEFPHLPIGLLVYANLVLHDEPARFYQAVRHAGVDSVLVADAPVGEAERFLTAAEAADVAPVLIAPPNAGPETLGAIAAASRGYVYVVSRPGVTGTDERLRSDSEGIFHRLHQLGSAPGLLGFGVSGPEHVRSALTLGAAGAISGSAIVALIERWDSDPGLADRVGRFAATMKAATR